MAKKKAAKKKADGRNAPPAKKKADGRNAPPAKKKAKPAERRGADKQSKGTRKPGLKKITGTIHQRNRHGKIIKTHTATVHAGRGSGKKNVGVGGKHEGKGFNRHTGGMG